MDNHTDESLLDLYFEGNAKAFEVFFKRHIGRVVAYAKTKGLSAEIAKDVSQEAFLKLHRNIHRYERGRPALPWFFTIVHHCVVDTLRLKVRLKEIGGLDLAQFPGPSAALVAATDVDALITNLSEEQRRVLQLRVIDELSFKEMAATTGKTEVSLRKIFERARTKLNLALISEE